MELVSDRILSARLIDKGDDFILPKSRIYIDEQASATIVDGACLEIAVKVDKLYMVFMTDDIPYEDILRIYLFDQKAVVLDTVILGSPYATGVFRFLEFAEPGIVTFTFIGLTKWKLQVFKKKKFHIPFLSDPSGVLRRMRFSGYLRIEGLPVAESS